jgi:hypothetical protein
MPTRQRRSAALQEAPARRLIQGRALRGTCVVELLEDTQRVVREFDAINAARIFTTNAVIVRRTS